MTTNALKIFTWEGEFVTERGERIVNPQVAYQTWGSLNADGSNAVLVTHALTGSADADQWWHGLFRREGVLDLERQFIVCSNVLGGCYGTTGPLSVNPLTGELYSGKFPVVSIRDMVRLQQKLIDHLGITSIEAGIGGSMGGMQILEWAIMDDRLKSMIVIGTDAAHSAWAIGISEAQRQAIFADQGWMGGNYHSHGLIPQGGLAAARMMAMITYRSFDSFNQRYSRNLQPGNGNMYTVSSYLQYQGKKLVDRFDAVTYVRLTQAMDSHDVARGRGSMEEVLGSISIPSLIVGIDSDVLYPVAEQLYLAEHLPNAQYADIKSDAGHDAFLIEFEQLERIIRNFQGQIPTHHFNLSS